MGLNACLCSVWETAYLSQEQKWEYTSNPTVLRKWEKEMGWNRVRVSSRLLLYSTRQVRLRQRSPLSKETKSKVFPFSDKRHSNVLLGDTEWVCLSTLWERATAVKWIQITVLYTQRSYKSMPQVGTGLQFLTREIISTWNFLNFKECLHNIKGQIDKYIVKW